MSTPSTTERDPAAEAAANTAQHERYAAFVAASHRTAYLPQLCTWNFSRKGLDSWQSGAHSRDLIAECADELKRYSEDGTIVVSASITRDSAVIVIDDDRGLHGSSTWEDLPKLERDRKIGREWDEQRRRDGIPSPEPSPRAPLITIVNVSIEAPEPHEYTWTPDDIDDDFINQLRAIKNSGTEIQSATTTGESAVIVIWEDRGIGEIVKGIENRQSTG